MKKMGYRILAAAASVLLAVTPLSVSAELLEPPIRTSKLYSIVIAVNEGGNCLIMDSYQDWVITQDEFHQYAGVDFDLKPGDVVFCYDAARVTSSSYSSGYFFYQDGKKNPLEVEFKDTATIKYLGTAEEFYGDQVKELTVTDTTKSLMVMRDEDGALYYTKDSYDWGWAASGESYGIPSGGYHVGDKVLCATVNDNQSSYPRMSAIILKKTYEAEEPDYNILSPIVTAVSEDGESCLLSDGTTVTQTEFREKSGEVFALQKGDVISVEGEQITYLGKAQEIYADYVKELTVSDMDKNAEPVWRDEEGIVYHADISYADNWRKSGVPNNGQSLYHFWVGDTALCVTGVTENADYYGCGAVILEITSEVERPEPTMWSAPIVVAVAGNDCLLDNEVAISQSEFKKYSGEDFDLEVGDVIWMQRTDGSGQCVMETYPGQYCVDIYTRMIYCGKAKDYYADKLMELTVTDVKNGYPVWSDADGVTYSAVHSYYPTDMGGWADSVGFAPYDFSIGDRALFAVGYINYSNMKSAIILEKTFEAEYNAGDATGDGETNLLDVVAINKNIMIGEKLTPAGKKAADFNKDGRLDPSESLHLLKYLVKVVDTLQF